MEIRRNNYEAWLLDLIEGRLAPDEVQQVHDFLLLNPDCALGIDDLETWILEAEKISFSGKATLRKELPDSKSIVSEEGFDLFSIAMMEGDLTENQEKEYLQMLKDDDEKMKEWLLWKQIRLTGKTILFHHKRALKKRFFPRSSAIWISIASAAAVAILFFTLFQADQDLSPVALVTAEADIESRVEQEASELTELVNVSKESSSKTALLASDPTILSIKKHQDPPELTHQKSDTSSLIVKEADLQERPLRSAMLERDLLKQAIQGSYDRIEPLDLPLLHASSDQLVEDQYSEDGLRQAYREFVEEKNISFLTIASAGVERINRLVGSDVSLNVSRDERGEVMGFRFRSSLLSVDSPGKKQNNSQ